MALTFNIRHLENQDLELEGTLEPSELELEDFDELIQTPEPLHYKLHLEQIGENVLVQGSLNLTLQCACSRCLAEYRQSLSLDPWICNLPLAGEERVSIENDLVDLTPFIREDILLAFPRHPLCKIECGGLPYASAEKSDPTESGESSSAWAELNKLKF
jgi:uncharacterized protein